MLYVVELNNGVCRYIILLNDLFIYAENKSKHWRTVTAAFSPGPFSMNKRASHSKEGLWAQKLNVFIVAQYKKNGEQ